MESIQRLTTLNEIAETLNRAVDVRSALNDALAHLVELMGLETGWIFVREETAQEPWFGRGYTLAAYHNLPPALALDNATAWHGGCDCQGLSNKGKLAEAYNEVRCSRLGSASGDRRGLVVHASTPLRSGDQVLGILNVAGPSWDAFGEEALALLTNVGSQMGIALERAQLYDLMREQRVHEQAALLNLSNQLLSRQDLDDMICCLVDEVKRLLQVDASALLLPDEDEPGHLVFRAAVGWRSDPVSRPYRVPADDRSGSGWVMRTQRPLLVASQDEQPPFWTVDWLQVEGFQAAAIVPLVANGRSIGTLVIDTRRPRRFTQDEIHFLQLMANQAAIAIEKARLQQEEIERQRLEKELSVARQIQLSLLPKAAPVIPGWDFASVYQAARQVGGDFYDFFELPERPKPAGSEEQSGKLGLVIADVADKGVPAALFMALSRTMIRTTALSGCRPAEALRRANELILQDSWTDLFLSAFYATLDTRSGRLIYANAGHNRPLWFQITSGEFHELAAQGIVLGILESVELEERQIELASGDLLILYTDGITEATTPDFQEFGEERLRAVVASNSHRTAAEIVSAIIDAVNSFTLATPQSDDFTLVVVKREETPMRGTHHSLR